MQLSHAPNRSSKSVNITIMRYVLAGHPTVAIAGTSVYIEHGNAGLRGRCSRIQAQGFSLPVLVGLLSRQFYQDQGGQSVALSDRTLVCVDCGAEFVFTVGEQEFFNSRGFVNDPKRCQTCRSGRRAEQRGGGFDGAPREMHPIVCAQCGADAMVPFRPRGDRPVYCSDCFSNARNSGL
jgi:CxxC-x17-CxxC domain-containing protein